MGQALENSPPRETDIPLCACLQTLKTFKADSVPPRYQVVLRVLGAAGEGEETKKPFNRGAEMR